MIHLLTLAIDTLEDQIDAHIIITGTTDKNYSSLNLHLLRFQMGNGRPTRVGDGTEQQHPAEL